MEVSSRSTVVAPGLAIGATQGGTMDFSPQFNALQQRAAKAKAAVQDAVP
jgi:hypothetical protein